MKQRIKKWIVSILVFWGLLQIFSAILSYLSIPYPYALIGILLMILLSLVFTSLLVNERNNDD
ncbi:hypothetical protein [Paenibacillus sanguinis]|uniref:hypothetical protein n=1 Tax=Paenibacillus sanguinis TaxID=225906 RepID=UPI000360B0CD|nr:hypothetical protein [Paenibacillus sanguinis]